MITGHFIAVNQGDPMERMVIGLGLGASEVKTRVQVYDELAAGLRLLQEFQTTAKSSIKPGIAETLPVGAAVSGVGMAAVTSTALAAGGEIPASVKTDARRTAQEIVKKLEPFLSNTAGLPPDEG